MDCKVYVGDLGYGAAKQELEDVFSKYGPLRNVWVARNPPGFAFVEFEDPRDAEDATRALDGTRMNGRRVRVEMSTGRSRRGGRRPLPSSGGPRYGGGSGGGGGGSGSSSYGRDRYRKRSRSYSPRRRSRSYSRSRSRSPSRERRRSISRERRGRSGSQDPFGRNVARGKSPAETRRRSYSRSRSKSPAWKSSAKSRSIDRSRSRSTSRGRGVNGLNGDNRD